MLLLLLLMMMMMMEDNPRTTQLVLHVPPILYPCIEESMFTSLAMFIVFHENNLLVTLREDDRISIVRMGCILRIEVSP